MIFSLLGIFLTIMWIIIGTSFKKFHPFLVLLIAPFLLATLLDISLMDALGQIKEGFGNIIQNNLNNINPMENYADGVQGTEYQDYDKYDSIIMSHNVI